MSDIAYQNKDITSKVLAENFREKSFRVYGLDIPKIIDVLPTNLPGIAADEMRIDNLFLLEDGTVAIVDYESAYKKANKVKYLGYIARVLDRYRKEGVYNIDLRMIVIYTADVDQSDTESRYDAGCLTLQVEEAFLTELSSEKIRATIERKVLASEPLSDEELMQFIVLPLTYRGNENKRRIVEETISLAKKIADENQMAFVLSGIVVFSDKIIDEETSSQVKEWIKMTKVGRLFEEERLRYGEAKQHEGEVKGLAEGKAEGIIGAVALLRRKEVEDGDILRMIMEEYSLEANEALRYMNAELKRHLAAG